MSRSTGFLGRLQLFSKGAAINEGLIPPGTYGYPGVGQEDRVLGNEIDVLPLAKSPQGSRSERQRGYQRQLRRHQR